MTQVSVLPVSMNNLQISLSCIFDLNLHTCSFTAWFIYQCKTSQLTTKVTSTQGHYLSGTVNNQEPVHWPGESGRL